MIYTGSDSKAQPPPPTAQQSNSSRSSPPQAPPTYNEANRNRAIPPVQPSYQQPHQAPSFQQPLIRTEVIIVRPETAGRRFFRAFLVALGIWFLLSVFFRTTIDVALGDWDDANNWKFDIPSTVDLGECVKGEWWKPTSSSFNNSLAPFGHSSEASFDLPLSSKTLFFLSRGQQLGGRVEIKTSAGQPRDSANVHVVLHYNNQRILERTKACLVVRKYNENGVGIFSPVYSRQPRWESSVTFEMTITLPYLGRGSLLDINNFETDFPNSRHDIKDLSNQVLFNTISLKGSNGRIEAEAIRANKGIFSTSNGEISGVFGTNDTLSLVTRNGAIRADVKLNSEDGSTPKLVARSSNGSIEASIRLTSTSGQGGAFDISASTSNSHLDLKFPESPVDSKLYLDASTSNSRASVDLNPAYEGSFVLRTSSLSSIIVDDTRKVEDPAGKDRMRVVFISERSKGYVAGNVRWDQNSQRHAGKVSVKTSNAPVHLGL